MTTQAPTLAYVYAITRASTPLPGDLTVVTHGELAAVVTEVDRRDVRARRRDLLRHADVVQQVFDRGTVLPLRFGTVVEDVACDLLAPRHDELTALLDRFSGLAEVTLRAYYREDDVLRRLLLDDSRLARLRASASPVELGEAVARALSARRDADESAIIRALRPHVRDIAFDERRTEYDVLRAALLVERDMVESLDAVVGNLAQSFEGTTTFKYVGPLSPHHFIELGGA